MKIVIFGIGFLGTKLMDYFLLKGFNVVGASISSRNSIVKELDARNKKEVEELLIINKPDIVIDTIALSSYYSCEKNHDLCKALNYSTAKNIAEVCKVINSKMIFISSSYVFDGEKGNYSETDKTNSTNEYARTKVLAEKKVLELKNSIVIRTEPMYGFDKGNNELKAGTNTFKSNVKNGYPNMLRSPIFIDDVPKIIFELIKNNQTGIFHIAGPQKTKWIDFLKKFASLINLQDKVKIVDSSSWILKPPHDSSLNTSKINALGINTVSFGNAQKKLRDQLNN